MKKLILILLLFPLVGFSQVWPDEVFPEELNKNFSFLGVQLDPLGSIDKKGLNLILSAGAIEFDHFEFESQIQILVNREVDGKGDLIEEGLTYADWQAGVGVVVLRASHSILTVGIHGGAVFRPKSLVENRNYTGWAASSMYGLTGKVRVRLTKRLGLVLSSAYDRRGDIGVWKLNTRGGFEWVFN